MNDEYNSDDHPDGKFNPTVPSKMLIKKLVNNYSMVEMVCEINKQQNTAACYEFLLVDD